MKTYSIYYIIILFSLLLLGSCKKDGEFVLKPIKAVKPFEMSGYVVADTLEQYFDGVKVRDLYGRVSLGYVTPQLAFENDIIVMQLKKKSTGGIIYEQKFNINDDNNVIPKFYFDGTQVTSSYQYPKPQGREYLVNFYLDAPKGTPPIDISLEVLEYYMDNDNKIIVVNTTSFPITTNLQIGKWTNYLTIEPPTEVVPTQEGTEIYPVVAIKDAKTKKYLINGDVVESSIQVEIPDQWTSQGKTQSIHLVAKVGPTGSLYFRVNDLVQFFPQ
ncbi:hypothetical protein ACSBL2_20655 [Pedobacter sp. AW31-3R]|uniref:hypothetical protein n=1 Tax=Pedobacter sp. AW31-3R TaxID=3445781 RepID=UPI003FA15D6E